MIGIATPRIQEITSIDAIDTTLITFALRLTEHIVIQQPLVQFFGGVRKCERGKEDERRSRQ